MQRHVETADNLLRRALQRLNTDESGTFSPEAFNELKVRISMYIRSLVADAAKIAKRRRADTISVADVEAASEQFGVVATRRWARHMGTIGGVLLGAALSNFLAMTTTGQYNSVGVISSVLMGVVGSFMVALHIGFN